MGWIEFIFTPLGPLALAALIAAVYLYANLSRRLGAVTKMPPYYRWFLPGGVLMALAFVAWVIQRAASLTCLETVAFLATPVFGLFFFHIPLLIGVGINAAVVWRYWSWLLLGER